MSDPSVTSSSWLYFALGSAAFAALTAIFGKLGVADINSDLATFIRTIVILVVTAVIVTARSAWEPLGRVSRFGMAMLILSGVATGLSWLCYYRALQLGRASKVAPVDKLSVVLVLFFAVVFLGEPLTWKVALGVGLVAGGVVVLAI